MNNPKPVPAVSDLVVNFVNSLGNTSESMPTPVSFTPMNILCYLFSNFFTGINNASIDLSIPTNMRETPTPNKIPPTTSSG